MFFFFKGCPFQTLKGKSKIKQHSLKNADLFIFIKIGFSVSFVINTGWSFLYYSSCYVSSYIIRTSYYSVRFCNGLWLALFWKRQVSPI